MSPARIPAGGRVSGNDASSGGPPPVVFGCWVRASLVSDPGGARQWRRRLPWRGLPRPPSTPGPDPICPTPGGACDEVRGGTSRIPHKERNQLQQHETQDEPHEWRNRKRDEDLLSLVPVDLVENRLSSDKRVRHCDADDRADVGVRRRVRDAQPPGAEVPPEGCHDECQEECDLLDCVDARDHFIGQQVHQSEGHRSATRQDAQEIHDRGEGHGWTRLHRVGIDHRRDSVGRVVESIHGLLKHDQEEDSTRMTAETAGSPARNSIAFLFGPRRRSPEGSSSRRCSSTATCLFRTRSGKAILQQRRYQAFELVTSSTHHAEGFGVTVVASDCQLRVRRWVAVTGAVKGGQPGIPEDLRSSGDGAVFPRRCWHRSACLRFSRGLSWASVMDASA